MNTAWEFLKKIIFGLLILLFVVDMCDQFVFNDSGIRGCDQPGQSSNC